jgi:beta-lactamase regulating signal transducer with metallopeptidase domain
MDRPKMSPSDSLAYDVFYDAVTPEVLRVTTDKLKIWLDDCQTSILKRKCNYFNSISNFISVIGIFITLVTTLKVTNFTSELWKAIYIVATFIVILILLYMLYKCWSDHHNRNTDSLSVCVMKKIKEESRVIYSGPDSP